MLLYLKRDFFMSNVTVYRYEAQAKSSGEYYGMFSINHYDKDFETICATYRRNIKGYIKEPQEDGCIGFHRGMLSACTTFHQLLKWGSVTNFRELENNGFRLAKYSVPADKLIHGGSQVVFHPDHAEFIGETNIAELKAEYRNNRKRRMRR